VPHAHKRGGGGASRWKGQGGHLPSEKIKISTNFFKKKLTIGVRKPEGIVGGMHMHAKMATQGCEQGGCASGTEKGINTKKERETHY
jgi:hypothetical protein